jgi:hypothetical protein
MGATTGQLVLLRQPQMFVVPVETQVGSSVSLVQFVLLRHWTHCPAYGADVSHKGSRPAVTHWGLDVHATHVSVVVPVRLQMGVFVLGFASQSESLAQATHKPAFGLPEGAQTGVEPLQSALLVQARQVWEVVSQMGVDPPQAESPPHAQGSPEVENCHSKTSCVLVSPPVLAVNPTKACAPTVVAMLMTWVMFGAAGFVALCDR